MQRLLRSAARLLALVLLLPASSPAQVLPEQDPLESMAIRVGPLGLSPSLAVTDFGFDSNVFNSSTDPQEDFTATVVPRLMARLRAGRMVLSASNATGFVYYRDFADERTVNYSSDVRVDASLGRMQPYLAASLHDTRERMNAELDIRAPRRQTTVNGGARMLVGSRTAVSVEARRSSISFDDGVEFDGIELSRTLNDTADAIEGGVHLTVTPLTTFSIASSWQRDRFEHAPERDSHSLRLMPSLQFDPSALIQGSVAVGYRRFMPDGPGLAEYSGIAVQTALTYALLDRARFDLRVNRDVQYSFEEVEPYYLATGVRLQVTYQLVGPMDVQGSAGRERLAYREAGTAETTGPERTDLADTLGAGMGYRVRDNLRLGVTWETTRRDSDRADRRYDRHRVFASLTYGI